MNQPRIETTQLLVFQEIFDATNPTIGNKSPRKVRVIFEHPNSIQDANADQILLCIAFWGEKAEQLERDARKFAGQVCSVSFNLSTRFVGLKNPEPGGPMEMPITEATGFKIELYNPGEKSMKARAKATRRTFGGGGDDQPSTKPAATTPPPANKSRKTFK